MKYTNDEIKAKHSICTDSHAQACIYYDTPLAEQKTFIGVLYLTGTSHGNFMNAKHLSRSEGCALEV